MRRFFSLFFAVIIAVCCIVASERQAWGYVDPGSGLLALQGFASVAAGVGFYMRKRVLALFDRKKLEPSPAPVSGTGSGARKTA